MRSAWTACSNCGAENEKAAGGLPHSKCKYVQKQSTRKRSLRPEKRMPSSRLVSGCSPRPSRSPEARNSREPVKTRIEAQDSFDSMLLHDRQMQCIASGHLSAPHHNLFRALGCGPADGEHFIGDAEYSVECGLDGIAPVYRHIAVQDLLQDFGIRNQALPVADQIFQQTLRVGLVRMGRANKVHRDIRVDQNQGCMPAPYPLSISASIRSISAEGKSCRAAARITSSFFPTPAPGSRRRARSRACRTHSAIDMRRERATR